MLLNSCSKKVTPKIAAVSFTVIYPTPEIELIDINSNQVKSAESIKELGYKVILTYSKTQSGKDFYTLVINSNSKEETLYIPYGGDTMDVWKDKKYKIKIKKKED